MPTLPQQNQQRSSSSSSSPASQLLFSKSSRLQMMISILVVGVCLLNYWHAVQMTSQQQPQGGSSSSSSSSHNDDDGLLPGHYRDQEERIHQRSTKEGGATAAAPPAAMTKKQALMESFTSSSAAKAAKHLRTSKNKTSTTTTTMDKHHRHGSATTEIMDDTIATTTTSTTCQQEFQQLTSNRTHGLTREDFRRSRAWVGNEQRLVRFLEKLQGNQPPDDDDQNKKNGKKYIRQPVHVVAAGGSITMGHGVEPKAGRYSNRLEAWLNANFPFPPNSGKFHTVTNRAAHGADMCAMAKRMDIIFKKRTTHHEMPDLIILEFAVNDYQGQDHKINVDHKTDVFFDGFLQKAMCAEAVVHNLMNHYPHTAILFLEFQSAVVTRKTAQLLHMGVAQHYQIPVVSYAEAIMPGYYRLLDTLAPYNWTAPIGEEVFPYPHGCVKCQIDHMIPQFQPKGCTSLCDFAAGSGIIPNFPTSNHCPMKQPPKEQGREHCHVPFFAHDSVHPSYVGHGVATDLIVHALATAKRNVCEGMIPPDHVLPPNNINFLGSNEDLSLLTDFVFVKDTMDMFDQRDHLHSMNHTDGFDYFGDNYAERRGWICTEEKGGDYIDFTINLPDNNDGDGNDACYVIYLSTLRSYEGMGTFTVRMLDVKTKNSFEMDMDGIWEPHISVPADLPLTPSNGQDYRCTGKCKVTVMTHPKHPDRSGNKVKIMSLSARKCRAFDIPPAAAAAAQ